MLAAAAGSDLMLAGAARVHADAQDERAHVHEQPQRPQQQQQQQRQQQQQQRPKAEHNRSNSSSLKTTMTVFVVFYSQPSMLELATSRKVDAPPLWVFSCCHRILESNDVSNRS